MRAANAPTPARSLLVPRPRCRTEGVTCHAQLIHCIDAVQTSYKQAVLPAVDMYVQNRLHFPFRAVSCSIPLLSSIAIYSQQPAGNYLFSMVEYDRLRGENCTHSILYYPLPSHYSMTYVKNIPQDHPAIYSGVLLYAVHIFKNDRHGYTLHVPQGVPEVQAELTTPRL